MLSHGGDVPQSGEPLRRQGAQRPPCSLEFVDFSDQAKDLRSDLDCGSLDHGTQLYTQLHPFTCPPKLHVSDIFL